MPWGEAKLSAEWRNCDSVQKTRRFPHTRRAALGGGGGLFLEAGKTAFGGDAARRGRWEGDFL